MTALDLATDYLIAVDTCLSLFFDKYGRRDVVRAWREGEIPQYGELLPGVEYQMHGVGCTVEYRGQTVSFDFFGRHDVGFDAWRLWLFAEESPRYRSSFPDLDAVKEAVAQALLNGHFERAAEVGSPTETNSRLLRFASS